MKQIVEIMLTAIKKRTKSQLGMELLVMDDAKEFLIEKGYDEKYGARPLRRTIQNQLEDLLAEEILDGHIKENDTVSISKGEQGLHFDVV